MLFSYQVHYAFGYYFWRCLNNYLSLDNCSNLHILILQKRQKSARKQKISNTHSKFHCYTQHKISFYCLRYFDNVAILQAIKQYFCRMWREPKPIHISWFYSRKKITNVYALREKRIIFFFVFVDLRSHSLLLSENQRTASILIENLNKNVTFSLSCLSSEKRE